MSYCHIRIVYSQVLTRESQKKKPHIIETSGQSLRILMCVKMLFQFAALLLLRPGSIVNASIPQFPQDSHDSSVHYRDTHVECKAYHRNYANELVLASLFFQNTT